MATENPSLKLGDLLTSAGLLKPTDLREAMMIARQQQLPVGRVLIMNGYLSEGQLQSAVQAQSMIKDGIIDLDTAVEALDLVATEHISLDESLIRMGWTMNNQTITNKLGEFLVEAELVAPADIHYALEQCREIGLPLGRVLVVTGYLTEEMLTNSLNAQVLVRDGRLSREQAVHGLRAALERQITLEESLQQNGFTHAPTATKMRLGELLLGANLIDEASLMNAVEIGLVSEKLIGQVLVEQGTLSPQGLENSLILQNMVAQGELYAQDAILALQRSIQNNVSAYDALQSLHEPAPGNAPVSAPGPVPLAEPLGLYQFLQLGGLITPQDVEQAMHTSARDTYLMGQMLQFAGIMPEYMVEASKEALDLINRGALTIEQGMVALKQCFSSNCSLQDAFREMNWEFHEGAPVHSQQAEPMPQAPQPAQVAFEPVPTQPAAEPAQQNSYQQFTPPQAMPTEMPSGAYRAAPHYATPGSPATSSSGFAPVPENTTASGSFHPVPQNNTASGGFDPAPQSNTASGSFPPVPQNTTVSGSFQPVPQQPQYNTYESQPPQQQAPFPVAPQPMPAPMPQPFAQQNTSGAQQPLAPQPAPVQQAAPVPQPLPAPQFQMPQPEVLQQADWTQSQSGAQQALRRPPSHDDVTLSAQPLDAPSQPTFTAPRVDAINPWAAKSQAPSISPVTSAHPTSEHNQVAPNPLNQVMPQEPAMQSAPPAPDMAAPVQAAPFAAPSAPPAPPQQNPFTAPTAQQQQQQQANPFAAPPAQPQVNPFAAPPAPLAAPEPQPVAPPVVQQNPFAAPASPQQNPFAAPPAPVQNPFAAPPAQAPPPPEAVAPAPQMAPPAPPAPEQPAPPAPAAAEESAPPKRKKLNDLMPKSKK